MTVPYSGAVPDPPAWRTYPLDPEPGGADERVRRRAGLRLGGAVAVLAGIGAGAWGLVAVAPDHDGDTSTTSQQVRDVEVSGSTSSTTTSTTTVSTGVDLFTTDGMAGLVAAIRAETGSTAVLELTMFPRWAVVTVPHGSGTRTFSWNGALTAERPVPSPRTSFDLRVLDGTVLARLCDGNTTTCFVVAGRPQAPGDAWLTVTDDDRPAQRTDLAGNPA